MKRTLPPSSLTPPGIRVLLLCVLSHLGAAHALAQNTDLSGEVIDHVHGVVLNSIDRKPVSRVLVASDDQRMATMTDAEGRFAFDVRRRNASGSRFNSTASTPAQDAAHSGPIRMAMRPQPSSLYLRKPGYMATAVPLRLSADPNTTSEEIQLKIVPTCIIRGHLSVATGNAPSGVWVQLRGRQIQFGIEIWAQAGGMRVNSHGDFRFTDIPAGDYKIMSSAWTEDTSVGQANGLDQSSGYKPAFYTEAADLTSSPALHLRPGDVVEADLNLRAVTLYRVSIPLPRADAASVNVIVDRQNEEAGYTLAYNSQSQAIEGFLPNGAYDIHVSAFGPQPTSGRGRVEVANQPVTGAPITLVPNGQIPVILHKQLTTAGAGQLAGPSRSAEVFLRPMAPNRPGANLKNMPRPSDDNLILDNVQEGTYRVLANTYRGYVSAITANGVDLLRQPLIVGPGGASEPIEVTLRDDSATVTGTLALPDGQSEPDTQVIVTFLPLNNNYSTLIPQAGVFQGKFAMPNLPPGKYVVVAIPTPANIDYLNPTVLSHLQSQGTIVDLGSGEKQEIRVPLLSDSAGEN